jgi:16S rRNA (cytidine1402-2'-O)-methyltransferase
VGNLYVVGTPIGNLEDITFRAVRVLRDVALIAAEDTRTTRTLLRAHDVHTALTSFHEFSGPEKVRRLTDRLVDQDVALVSDAGMPGLSDPGFPLIRAAIDAGHTVVPIPGPSAILTALVASGMPLHEFHFLGFLPRKSGERRRAIEAVAEEPATLVAFESPHRLLASLADALAVLGDRPMAAGRELTKKFEQFVRGTISEVQAHFAAQAPRGEFTLVIAGRPRRSQSR